MTWIHQNPKPLKSIHLFLIIFLVINSFAIFHALDTPKFQSTPYNKELKISISNFEVSSQFISIERNEVKPIANFLSIILYKLFILFLDFLIFFKFLKCYKKQIFIDLRHFLKRILVFKFNGSNNK